MIRTHLHRRLAGLIVAVSVAIAAAVTATGALADVTIGNPGPITNGTSLGYDFTHGTGSGAGEIVAGNGLPLVSFTLFIDVSTDVRFTPAIFEWDGSHTTTLLWSGATIGQAAHTGYQAVTFTVPSVVLQTGTQYMLVVTTVGSGGSGGGGVGYAASTPGSGGFAAEASIDPSLAITALVGASWGTNSNSDLVFSATFTSPSAPSGPTPEPNIGHMGYCAVAGNTWQDGNPIQPGTFLNLVAGQPQSDSHYTGAVPAIFVKGIGITCAPAPAGYIQHGFATADMHVPAGVYPYWEPGS